MKKRGNHENKAGKSRHHESNSTDDKKNEKNGNKKAINVNDDIQDQGFGDWLRSSDGIEMMRLFVIANSILIFFTMGWPKIQETITILKQYFYVEE
ncbi:exit protein of rhodopsin and TRP A [Calliopsis andreniformis]|uniref:exit protein of rhodopsin and TRP A n=1 Tax=Calliopsis andreniformis TaxID=337506 RepID=UPI003FCCEF28